MSSLPAADQQLADNELVAAAGCLIRVPLLPGPIKSSLPQDLHLAKSRLVTARKALKQQGSTRCSRQSVE